jgi:2-C-methyl-D-erythritol 4-phosphate cytidylyltransferase
VAAGVGRRFGDGDRPKQYANLAGKPLVTYSLDAFERLDSISEIAVVIHPDHRDLFDCLIQRDDFKKLRHVVIGGKERQDSVISGLAALEGDGIDIAAVHDAARPFPPQVAIDEAIAAAAESGAAILASPVADTIKECDASGLVVRTLDRSLLWAAQTPQVARLPLLRDALRKARDDGALCTDEAAALERVGVSVRIIPSPPANIKITSPADLELAELFLSKFK